MYIISFSCIIYTYCKLILKSPSGRINKSIALYCIVLYCNFIYFEIASSPIVTDREF